MWLHHLLSLFATFISYFFNAIGTTLLGLLLGLTFAATCGVATLVRINSVEGRDAMLTHWREDVKVALRISAVCASVLYGPVILWKATQVVYDDHNALVARSRVQRGLLAKGTDVQQKIVDADTQKYNDLRVSCAQVQGAVGQLQSKNTTQQTTINKCQTKALALLQPEALRIETVQFGIPNITVNGKATPVFTVIGLTNRSISPVEVNLECSAPISKVLNVAIGSSGVFAIDYVRPTTPTSVAIRIASPAWTPSAPLGMAVFGQSDAPMICQLKRSTL